MGSVRLSLRKGEVLRSWRFGHGWDGLSQATPGDMTRSSPTVTLWTAPALQVGLEQLAKPWYRPRALRVFRDRASLAANPGLWSSIETALASSTWLVLMVSPNAARSPWVNREVEWWLANKSPRRLLMVLTEGEFAWDDDTGRGEGATAALPPPASAIKTHVRAIDHQLTPASTPPFSLVQSHACAVSARQAAS